MTAFQSTVDELLTQKLQMLGGAAADENDSDVNRKLIKLLFMTSLISTKFSLCGCCYDNNKTVIICFTSIVTGE